MDGKNTKGIMYVIAIMEKITYSYIVVHKLESSGRENI
jgi:hypothetical protein